MARNSRAFSPFATPKREHDRFFDTLNDQLLMEALATPVAAQVVQIRTVSSPSWVAWSEIQVFESMSAIPIPPSIWLFGIGILGLIGFSKRKPQAAL